MNNLPGKYYLEITVFICGAVVMIIELIGSRFLAPHFGTSLYVWSSIIGIIMGSLSLGYWLGGRMSMIAPEKRILSLVVFFAALSIIGLALAKDIILGVADSLAGILDIRWGALFASMTLFALPNVLLGMVSPYAARLKIDQIEKSGREVGELYAISTIGSILGTFVAGFWLIGTFPAEQINIGLAAILVITSTMIDPKSLRTAKWLTLAAILLIATFSKVDRNGLPLTFDTSYARYQVKEVAVDSQTAIRMLTTDSMAAQSVIYIHQGRPFGDMAASYNRYFLLGGHFVPEVKNGLLIGGGAFGFVRGFLESYPAAAIDVVEIDPSLTGIAQKYFYLEMDPRLKLLMATAGFS